MTCLIKDGKYYNSKGQESKLYKDLLELVGEQEAHSLFVLSHTDTFKKYVQNKTKEVVKDLIPKGTNFKETVVNGIRTFHIYEGANKIGRIQLKKYKEGFKVKSALVDENMKGKGFGKALYAYAVYRLSNEGATLYTDTFRTEDADRVWERLQKQDLTEDGKTIPPINSVFTSNGEPKVEVVLRYSQDNFSLAEPLTQEEILELSTLQLNVETSDELYDILYDTFYKNGIFEPQLKKMQKIYTEEEIRTILEDVEIQARIKETVEKLRHTEEFNITQIEYDKDFSYKDLVINIIGQYKSNNPLQDKQVYEQENGVEGEVLVEVINEEGEAVEEQLIYENAVKVVKDPKIIDAVETVINAPQEINTAKVEGKVKYWLRDYGLNIKNLTRNNYQKLLDFIKKPAVKENVIALEKALGFERTAKKQYVKIESNNRTYKILKTTKSEQQLFDELSLIKTNTPNVYHKISKIDEQEIRDAVDNQDLTVPVYELYREYFDYGLKGEMNKIKEQSIANGTFMKAPNGKPTNLSEDNWLFVRTQSFKNWSNDWKNTLLDENNEPKVFFHSSKEKGITEFLMRPSNDDLAKGGFFVTPKKGWDFAKTGIEYQLFVGYNNKDIFDIENEDNVADFAYKIFDDYRQDLGKIEYSDIFDIITPGYIRTYYTVFKEKYSKEIEERSKIYKEKNLFDEFGDFYRVQSKEELLLEDLEKYRDKTDELSLVLNTLNDIDRRHSLYRNYTSIERNGEILEKLGFKGAYVFESKVKNIHLYNTDRIKSAENTRAQIEQESNDIRYFKKPSNLKINTNIETDIDYLTDEFVAEFATEKIKNPNNEFYQQFKINENGIELISNDELTIAKVKSNIKNYPKLADYSLISKNMPDLKDVSLEKTGLKEDRRIQAINNKQSVPQPKTAIEIIDDQFIKAPNETSEWLRIGDTIYEMQEEGIYSKLDFVENANYYTFKVDTPPYKLFEQKETKVATKTVKKLTDKKTDNENFSCL